MKISDLDRIIRSQQAHEAVALVTCLEDNMQRLYTLDSVQGSGIEKKAVAEAFRTDKSKVVELSGKQHFVHVFSVPLRLIIIGAVHISQPLISMSKSCGYEITLVDPRRTFATPERFPGVNVVHKWPDVALQEIGLNSRSAVVTLTHDPKLDEPALLTALKSTAFYIGALGSRRTHQKRCERLLQSGVTAEQLERIHAPIGMNISAQSPAEIAVAILAEVTQSLRNRIVP